MQPWVHHLNTPLNLASTRQLYQPPLNLPHQYLNTIHLFHQSSPHHYLLHNLTSCNGITLPHNTHNLLHHSLPPWHTDSPTVLCFTLSCIKVGAEGWNIAKNEVQKQREMVILLPCRNFHKYQDKSYGWLDGWFNNWLEIDKKGEEWRSLLMTQQWVQRIKDNQRYVKRTHRNETLTRNKP